MSEWGAEIEAQRIDREAERIAKAERIDKGEAYARFLSSPAGMRALADYRVQQGCFVEAAELRVTARKVEERVEAIRKAQESSP